MNFTHQSFVALCPRCDSPFHFTQTKFLCENDSGGWVVKCSDCGEEFKFPILNPRESTTKEEWRVRRLSDWPGDELDIPISMDLAVYNFPLTKLSWKFDVDAAPLFRCERASEDLDAAAYRQLMANRDELEREWSGAENWLLASGSGGDRKSTRLNSSH